MLLDVWFLKAISSLLVKGFKVYGKEKCQNAEGGKYNERYGIVIRYEVRTSILCGNYSRIVGIC